MTRTGQIKAWNWSAAEEVVSLHVSRGLAATLPGATLVPHATNAAGRTGVGIMWTSRPSPPRRASSPNH